MNISETTTKPILNWIRKETRRGLKVGGLCTAAFTLAKAGMYILLTGHHANGECFDVTF